MQMYDGMLQMTHPDRVVDEAGFAKLIGHRSGLSAHRRAGAGFAAPRDGAGAAEAAGLAGMDQPGSDPPLQVSADRRGAEPRACAGRADGYPARWPVLVAACLRRIAGRSIGAGAGARAIAPPRGRPPCRRRPSAQQDHRRAALCADGVAAAGRRRDRRRSAPAGADAAAAAGRCRIGQDRGGAAGRRRRHRGRQAGRVDGADGNPGAPAHQDHHAAGRARGPAGRDPHRAREGQGAARTAGAA